MAVMYNLTLSKKNIKSASQDWFDAEIVEKINQMDKLFKKSKKSCLHVNKVNYKEARNEVQKLIHTKKKAYFERKSSENIGKPKELRKSLESLCLKLERSISNINCRKMLNLLILMLKI